MKYPPTFKGFLRAAFDTIVRHPNNYPKKKHLVKNAYEKEHYWQLKDYEIYEPDKDLGKEFWQKKAEELVERKEQEKFEAEERMIEDYEFRHKDDREDAVETEAAGNPDEPGRTDGEAITEGIDKNGSEAGADDGIDDFESDADFDSDSGDGFDSDFDSDSGSYDG